MALWPLTLCCWFLSIDFCPLNFCPLNFRLSNFCPWTFIHWTSVHKLSSVKFLSVELPSTDFRLSNFCRSNFRPWTFVRQTFVYWTFVHPETLIWCLLDFRPAVLRPAILCFIVLLPTVMSSYLFIWHLFDFVRPSSNFRWTFVWPTCNVCESQVIPNDALYFSNRTLCLNFVASAVYYHKILGHGPTPCPRMMKTLLLNQSPGISYKITHNPLSRFL